MDALVRTFLDKIDGKRLLLIAADDFLTPLVKGRRLSACNSQTMTVVVVAMNVEAWSSFLAPVFALAVLGVIVFLLRWAFSTRSSTARLASPSPNVDDPRLRVISSIGSENEGLAKCLALSSHGVESELIRSGGRLYLAVHVAQVRTARIILGIPADHA